MSKYSYKNLELALKFRVLAGFVFLIVSFILFIIGCIGSVNCLINSNNEKPILSLALLFSICFTIIVFHIWFKYYKDIRLEDNEKLVSIEGRILSFKEGVVTLETDSGLDVFLIPNRVIKSEIELKENELINVKRCKNSGFICEIVKL